jgi:hypothetical protein
MNTFRPSESSELIVAITFEALSLEDGTCISGIRKRDKGYSMGLGDATLVQQAEVSSFLRG